MARNGADLQTKYRSASHLNRQCATIVLFIVLPPLVLLHIVAPMLGFAADIFICLPLLWFSKARDQRDRRIALESIAQSECPWCGRADQISFSDRNEWRGGSCDRVFASDGELIRRRKRRP
ncbi:MAG: hypothetical protein KF699_16045 [Phycisphaeraceae bacterium]|nr:hypothetical protein [Phycisphaeraceae bacterium]MBX3407606.1 hypothetical protein [Phycisphaeraceae bacterium]